jgi:predicted TPR repeat methyltransferase
LSESGDFQAAADLMVQALELAPVWAAGWYELGKHLEKAGKIEGAVSAYQTVLGLSPNDRFGARLKLAHLAGVPLPAEPQTAYVEALFDHYAEKFDSALTGKLQYKAPELVAALISRHANGAQFDHVVDLGCGTGLMAVALSGMAGEISGIDISAAMLAKAEERGLYRQLVKADLTDGLAQLSPADLIVAADVFVYFSGLERVFEAVGEKLTDGGLFAFSVERLEGETPYTLQRSLRHAHSEQYVRQLLAANGLDLVGLETAVLRRDRDAEIIGQLYLARKAGA